MLKTIDRALAGAIDVVADDIQATMKSVKEQGLKRTLGDAVEDAGSMVKGGVTGVFGNIIKGRGAQAGPQKISGHSGLPGSYADMCAGSNVKAMGGGPGGPVFAYNGNGGAAFPYNGNQGSNVKPIGGGAAFPYNGNGGAAFPYDGSGGIQPGIQPYQPPAGGKGRGAAAPQFTPSGFAPGIGIQRQGAGGASPGAFNPAAFRPLAPATTAPPQAFNPPPSVGSGGGLPAPASGAKEAPVPQEAALAHFDMLKARDPGNARCFDCNAANAEWASVSFGVIVCIDCSGRHRQLGTHISRIRSARMDSWTTRALQIFDHGGNSRAHAFFAANGVPTQPALARYTTAAAEWYREGWIKNKTLGQQVPEPPQGVNAGPCVDRGGAVAAKAESKPKAPDNLMDFGASEAPANAPAVDLLDIGGAPAAPAAPPAVTPAAGGNDLLGLGAPSAGGDLLGLSGPAAAPPAGGGDLLSLGAPAGEANLLGLGGTAPLPDLGELGSLSQIARPAGGAFVAPSHQLSGADAAALKAMQAEVRTSSTAAPAMMYAARPEPVAPKVADEAANPFKIALDKWGM